MFEKLLIPILFLPILFIFLRSFKLSLYLVGVISLVFTGLTLYLYPSLGYIQWCATIASLLMFFKGLHRGLIDKTLNLLPLFVFPMGLFVIYSIIISLANYEHADVALAAAKNYFQFWSIPIVLTVAHFNQNNIKRYSLFVLIIALLQAPISVWQYIVASTFKHRISIGDSVTGTFNGSSFGGGSSGAQSTFLMVIIFTVVICYLHRRISFPKLFFLIFVLIIPIFLNETKVSVFYLVIGGAWLLLIEFKNRPVASIMTLGIILVLAGVITMAYFSFMQHSGRHDRSSNVSAYVEKKLGSQLTLTTIYEGKPYLTRIGSIRFWYSEVLSKDLLKGLIGYGLGATKVSGQNVGYLNHKYKFTIGVTQLSSLLWEVGIFGTVIYFSIFGFALLDAKRNLTLIVNSSFEKALLLSVCISIPIFLICIGYDRYILNTQGLSFFVFLLLGYIGYINSKFIMQKYE